MNLLSIIRLLARVFLSGLGVLLALGAAIVVAPGGCMRLPVPAMVPTGTTLRASKLQGIEYPVVAPMVLQPSAKWQLLQVRRIVDGDTYELQWPGGLARLRLLGVDAPEHDQPYGAQVADSVGRLLKLRFAWVRITGVDQYGRNLGAVRLRAAPFSRGRAVALDSLLVVRGWAWAYAPTGQAVVRAAQQQQAAAAGRGLWKCGAGKAVRPGLWRAYTKQEKASAWVGCPW